MMCSCFCGSCFSTSFLSRRSRKGRSTACSRSTMARFICRGGGGFGGVDGRYVCVVCGRVRGGCGKGAKVRARRVTVWHSMAQHGTALYGTVRHSTTRRKKKRTRAQARRSRAEGMSAAEQSSVAAQPECNSKRGSWQLRGTGCSVAADCKQAGGTNPPIHPLTVTHPPARSPA